MQEVKADKDGQIKDEKREAESGNSEYESEGYENEGYDDFEDLDVDNDEPVVATPGAGDHGEDGFNVRRHDEGGEDMDHDDDMGDMISESRRSSRLNTACSRGNTAMSGATTLPRTRKGTRQDSPLRTADSEDRVSPWRASSRQHPKRLYLDSVGGGELSHDPHSMCCFPA